MLLWGGFIVSHIGDSIQLHAQSWLIADLTRSGLQVGAVALAQSCPRLILGFWSGVLVDRVNRHATLLVTQALAMGQTIGFLWLLATGRISFLWIVVLAGTLGVIDTINLNTRVAYLPGLVPRALIGRALSLQALGVTVMQILGPSFAALLIVSVGIEGCLWVNCGTFVVLVVALLMMRPAAAPPRADREGSFGHALREGLAFVRARPRLWGSFAMAYLLGLFGVSTTRLFPLYARAVLHSGARGYGMLAAASGVGALAASVFVTARARHEELPRNILVSAVAFSGVVGSLAFTRSLPAAVVAATCFGFCQTAFRSSLLTLVQLESPDRLRGRVNSLLLIDLSLWGIGAVLVGLIADRSALAAAGAHHDLRQLPETAMAVGLHRTFAIMGLLCLVSTALFGRAVMSKATSRA